MKDRCSLREFDINCSVEGHSQMILISLRTFSVSKVDKSNINRDEHLRGEGSLSSSRSSGSGHTFFLKNGLVYTDILNQCALYIPLGNSVNANRADRFHRRCWVSGTDFRLLYPFLSIEILWQREGRGGLKLTKPFDCSLKVSQAMSGYHKVIPAQRLWGQFGLE